MHPEFHNFSRRQNGDYYKVDPYLNMLVFERLEYTKHVAKILFIMSSVVCGVVILVLASIFLWRRQLVNRPSLRLIFAACIYNLIYCIIPNSGINMKIVHICRASTYIGHLFMNAAMLTTTAISVNLHLMILKPRWTARPKYLDYLLIIIPLTISLLFVMPLAIASDVIGVCDLINIIQNKTPAYFLYVWFLLLSIPLVCTLYSATISILIVIRLVHTQRKLSKLIASSSNVNSQTGSANTKQLASRAGRNQHMLKNIHRTYNTAFRISIYPLPVAFTLTAQTIYYMMQNSFMLTQVSDVDRYVLMLIFPLIGIPVTVSLDLIVFSFDPSLHKALKEVYITLKSKLSRRVHARNKNHTLSITNEGQCLENGGRLSYTAGDLDTSVSIETMHVHHHQQQDSEITLVTIPNHESVSTESYEYNTDADEMIQKFIRRHSSVNGEMDNVVSNL